MTAAIPSRNAPRRGSPKRDAWAGGGWRCRVYTLRVPTCSFAPDSQAQRTADPPLVLRVALRSIGGILGREPGGVHAEAGAPDDLAGTQSVL